MIECGSFDGQHPMKTKVSCSHPPVLKDYIRAFIQDYLADHETGDVSHIYQLVMHAVEPEVLDQVLSHVGGNQTEAAQLLGISRATLRKKIQKYDL